MEAMLLTIGAGVIVVVAALAAYRRVSSVVTFGVLFGAVLLWSVPFFTRSEPTIIGPLLEAIFWAFVATVVFGALGSALGRLAHRFSQPDERPTQVDQLLVGNEVKTSLGWIAVAVCSFGVAFWFFSSPDAQQIITSIPGSPRSVFVLGALLIGIPVVSQAYLNQGLLVSWVLSFSLPYALFLAGFLESGRYSLVYDVISAGMIASGVAIVLGAIGFVIGVGLRRATNRGGTIPSEGNNAV